MTKEKEGIPGMEELADFEVSGISGGTIHDNKAAGERLDAAMTALFADKLSDHDRRVLLQLEDILFRISNGGSSIRQNYSTAHALVAQIQEPTVRAKASRVMTECKSVFWR